MRWIYLMAVVAVFARLAVVTHGGGDIPTNIVETIARESGVPNAVSGILLRNRLYDTVFEVLVFTVAVLGVRFMLSRHRPERKVLLLKDEVSVVLARLGATLSALICFELALRGHLSPGGGFAAGVAGGTAIALVAITAHPGVMEAQYARLRASLMEKAAVILFLVLALLTLTGVELPHGDFGTLFSGGVLPLLNVLIAVKVMLGAWGVILVFIRYRGLL